MTFIYEVPPLVKKLLEIKNKSTKIYFGFPKGSKYAEIAKTLSFGHKGDIEYDYKGEHIVLAAKDENNYAIPPRPFLTDGFMASRVLITEKVKEYWEDFFIREVSSPEILGNFIVDQIKSFVMENPYQKGIGVSKMPQQSHKGLSKITGKMATASVAKAKGKAHPLVDSGGMVNAITWVVTHPKNIKEKATKK